MKSHHAIQALKTLLKILLKIMLKFNWNEPQATNKRLGQALDCARESERTRGSRIQRFLGAGDSWVRKQLIATIWGAIQWTMFVNIHGQTFTIHHTSYHLVLWYLHFGQNFLITPFCMPSSKQQLKPWFIEKLNSQLIFQWSFQFSFHLSFQLSLQMTIKISF